MKIVGSPLLRTGPAWTTISVILCFVSAFEVMAADFPRKETVPYRQVGDLAIKADVFYFGDAKVRPVIVHLHGGALIMGHREGISRALKEFALTNGYVLVSLDYRLAPETKLPDIISDVEAGFDWLRRRGPDLFHIDPARLAVTGGSAGGYLTLVTGYRVRPRPQVLLAYFGYGDLIGDWYATPSSHPRHNPRKISEAEARQQVNGPPIADARDRKGDGGIFYNFCRQQGLWPEAVSGWNPRTEAEKFIPYMPAKNVTADFPPTVLIHGTADTDVPFQQSEIMAKEFQKQGVRFQFHAIAHGEHGLAGGDPAEIDKAQSSGFAFLKTYLEK